jgi:hypothetical protein
MGRMVILAYESEGGDFVFSRFSAPEVLYL